MAEIHERAKRVSNALLGLGVQPGDRVATLAWNTGRHIEAWYGIMGIGAVCHTLNPRLFAEQLVYIINHAEDRVIFVDLTFVPLLAERAAAAAERRARRRHDRRRSHAGLTELPGRALLSRPWSASVRRRAPGAASTRTPPRPLLHLGHDRQSQGGAVFAPLELPAHPA